MAGMGKSSRSWSQLGQGNYRVLALYLPHCTELWFSPLCSEWPLTGTNGWFWVRFWKQGLAFGMWRFSSSGDKSRVFSPLWCTRGCSRPWGVWDAGAEGWGEVPGQEGSLWGTGGALLCAQHWDPSARSLPVPAQDTALGFTAPCCRGAEPARLHYLCREEISAGILGLNLVWKTGGHSGLSYSKKAGNIKHFSSMCL